MRGMKLVKKVTFLLPDGHDREKPVTQAKRVTILPVVPEKPAVLAGTGASRWARKAA